MTFVCYSLALGILGFAYQRPEEFLLLMMILAARHSLWGSGR
jgi:hypothetical protein